MKNLQDAIAVSLAGRVAEQLILGDISIGSGFGGGSDLNQATEIACSIELRFGLGFLGNIYVGASAIDDFARIPGLIGAVKKRLEDACERATEILNTRMEALRAVAEALNRSGYLSGQDVDVLIENFGSPCNAHRLSEVGAVAEQVYGRNA